MIRDVFVSIQYVMFKSMYKNIIRVCRYMRTTINKINWIISETVAIEIVPNKVIIFVTNKFGNICVSHLIIILN